MDNFALLRGFQESVMKKGCLGMRRIKEVWTEKGLSVLCMIELFQIYYRQTSWGCQVQFGKESMGFGIQGYLNLGSPSNRICDEIRV